MSRLASLQSTPSRRTSPSPSPSPAQSPARPTETTHHRMLKMVLAEVRNVLSTWDDIATHDGMKAGKSCIDEATEMDNILLNPEGPERALVGPHLERLLEARATLQGVLGKFERLLVKLNGLADQADRLFFEACKTQQYDFVLTDPLWLSWTFEDFVNSLSELVSVHNRHLVEMDALAAALMNPSTKFEDARSAIERWRDLGRGGERWEAAREWEEVTQLELAGPNPRPVEQDTPKKRGKR